MVKPVLYIIAGPNGIGKTTSTFDLVPQNIPIINSDEIAKEVRLAGLINVNTQEYSNREAVQLINAHLNNSASFVIETNLADIDTWKFLLEVQKNGYILELLYISTSEIEILNSRIEERHLRGEHYVRPDIVEERYINGLKLLNHYFNKPSKLRLIDNSTRMKLIAEVESGKIIHAVEPLPFWIESYLGGHFKPKVSAQTPVKELDSVDDVKKKYLESLKKKKE